MLSLVWKGVKIHGKFKKKKKITFSPMNYPFQLERKLTRDEKVHITYKNYINISFIFIHIFRCIIYNIDYKKIY